MFYFNGTRPRPPGSAKSAHSPACLPRAAALSGEWCGVFAVLCLFAQRSVSSKQFTPIHSKNTTRDGVRVLGGLTLHEEDRWRLHANELEPPFVFLPMAVLQA